MLRKYFDLLTGTETGGDNHLHGNVIMQLQGLKGEDIVDERVWAVKTHTPWLIEEAPAFRANKVIIIVRNPLDSIYSWFTCAAFYNH